MKSLEKRIIELKELSEGASFAIITAKSAVVVIEELQNQLDIAKSALNYIKSSDNATISAQKALETIKILGE